MSALKTAVLRQIAYAKSVRSVIRSIMRRMLDGDWINNIFASSDDEFNDKLDEAFKSLDFASATKGDLCKVVAEVLINEVSRLCLVLKDVCDGSGKGAYYEAHISHERFVRLVLSTDTAKLGRMERILKDAKLTPIDVLRGMGAILNDEPLEERMALGAKERRIANAELKTLVEETKNAIDNVGAKVDEVDKKVSKLRKGGKKNCKYSDEIDEKNRKVVGVEDPQRLIEDIPNKVISSMGIMPTFEIEEMDGKPVVAITVHPASYPVSYHGEFHVRIGATKQLLTGPMLTQFILDRTGLKWDEIPVDGVEVDDLDRESFDIFRRNALETGRMSESDLAVPNKLLLEKLKLLVNEKLTRAALLLFHPNPEKWVSTCYSKIGKFANDSDLLFNDEIHGSLLVQAEKLVDILFLKYLTAPISYRDQTRIESYPYSKDALRELVRNALMHQDFINGHPVQLSVYPDRLYLANAGGLPTGWKVGSLFKKHSSQARNELIASTLYRGGFVEAWGRGIDKVCRECASLGVPKPKYDVTESNVMVSIIARGIKSGTKSAPSQAPSQEFCGNALTAYERVLCFCSDPMSAREIMKHEGRTDLTKFRNATLAPMIKDGVLEPTVPDKPRSRLQKYRLTVKGRTVLEALMKRKTAEGM
ncbi:MAG: hypothetical protein K6G91_02940 [Kiritimatiellae bacterium]|nr:hypothetical protein [Kiritimatiellia bacterium]